MHGNAGARVRCFAVGLPLCADCSASSLLFVDVEMTLLAVVLHCVDPSLEQTRFLE